MSDIELMIAIDFEDVIKKHIDWFPNLANMEDDDISQISHELVQLLGNWKEKW